MLFPIEYDPNVAGVYLTFVVPRAIVKNEVVFQNLDRAEERGLTVDMEVPHTNRRIPAFADDANGGLERSKRDLELVKGILYDFGVMSGLETNVEKTTLMPIGCLDKPIPVEVLELGFEIVESIKCLGLTINNRATNLEDHFDGVILKIRKLINQWEQYNLSLMGKIGISKTMLVS